MPGTFEVNNRDRVDQPESDCVVTLRRNGHGCCHVGQICRYSAPAKIRKSKNLYCSNCNSE